MDLEKQQEVSFKSAVTNGILQLIAEGKKLNINNIALASKYPRKEIELNLYEIGLICEKLEED